MIRSKVAYIRTANYRWTEISSIIMTTDSTRGTSRVSHGQNMRVLDACKFSKRVIISKIKPSISRSTLSYPVVAVYADQLSISHWSQWVCSWHQFPLATALQHSEQRTWQSLNPTVCLRNPSTQLLWECGQDIYRKRCCGLRRCTFFFFRSTSMYDWKEYKSLTIVCYLKD
jgi:hypothetical protein